MHRAVMRTGPLRAVAASIAVTLAVMTGIAVSTGEAAAAVTTSFSQTPRFSVNTNGSVVLTGNTNLQCPGGNMSCTDAPTTNTEVLNNNGYNMVYADVDNDPATVNSSTADLTVPNGSRVLFAGLYWSADTTAGQGTGAPAQNSADYNRVKFAVPGGALTQVTASTTWQGNGVTAYQGFADVTQRVAGAGSGTYRVADIQAGTGRDRYAGWALVVAYENISEPMRSLRVFDGFDVVRSGNNTNSVDITIGGFQTPSTGTVGVKVGAVVYEGDLGKTGDALTLKNTTMQDNANPVDNFFNSTVSANGQHITARNPNWQNLMGVDVDHFDATGVLSHNETQAVLRLTTTGETVYPGALTFMTDLYAPKLVTTTTAVDQNGNTLLPGDTVEYTIVVRNTGTDSADATSLMTDAIPTGLTLVPGSVTLDNAAVADGNPLSFNLPQLGAGQTTTATFRARVNDDVAPGTTIVNVPNLSYRGTNNVPVTSAGDSSTLVVGRPGTDLRATLAVSPAVVNRASLPATVDYTATVRNNGPGTEPRPTVTVDLPTGVTATNLPGTCAANAQRVTCDLAALAPGTTGSVIIPATVADDADTGTATLTAAGLGLDSDSSNDTDTAVLTRNSSPHADTTKSASTTHGAPVTTDARAGASDHEDPAGSLTVSVSTPPGNGTTVPNTDGTITYTPNPGFRGVDTYVFRLTDSNGASDTGTVTVTVANAAPTAQDDSSSTRPNTPVSINVLANDTDLNNDPKAVQSVTQPQAGAGSVTIGNNNELVYTPAAGFKGTARFTYVVEDGQGGTDTADVVVGVGLPIAANDTATVPYGGSTPINVLANDTGPLTGTYSITAVSTPSRGTATPGNGQITYTAPAGFSGTATFTYTIIDSNGETDTATVTVTVGNATPAASNPLRTTAYRAAVTLAPADLGSDPNGDPLQITGTSQPANGTVAANPDGTITYTPNTGFTGTDTFTYTVSDGTATSTGTVTVTVGNAVPTALADSFTVMSNAPAELDVLGNDNDPNNDPLTITIDTMPVNGTAQVVSGKIVYRANDGFHGTDTLHYTVTDGRGGSAGATVSVTAVDVAPQADPDAAVTGTNGPVTINVLTNDRDANGDAITLTATTPPAHGTVTSTPAGTITYTPANGFYGTDTFTYTIKDPAGNTATATVTITVNNVAPNAIDDRFVVRPGVATELAVLANDTDPNTGQVLSVLSVGTASKGTVTLTGGKVTYTPNAGATGTDTFTYVLTDDLGATDTATVTVVLSGGPDTKPDTASVKPGAATDIDVTGNDTDPDGDALTLTGVTTPAHGTATIVNGKIRYTPAAGYTGTDTFRYTVRDPAGNTATQTVTVEVGNAAPVARADTAAVMGGKHVDVDVLKNDTDPNPGQKLTIGTVGKPAHGTAVVVDGKIRYTPEKGFAGTDTFTYTVSDGFTETTGTVTVTVSDGKPVGVPDQENTPYQQAVTLDVLANDLDPDKSLTLRTAGKPAHGTAEIKNGRIVYTPAAGFSGADTFEYTAQDATGQSITSTVTVTVGAAPTVPDKTVTAKPGKAVSIPLPTVDEHGIAIKIKSLGKPKHGRVRLNADGTVTYTPDKGFAGTDSFSYSAVDAYGNQADGTITVTVAGASKPPVAVQDRYTVAAGGKITISPTENDTDPYDNGLTIIKVGKPAHGTATLTGSTVTYVAAKGFTGTDTIAYTIRDERGGTAQSTITIRVTAAGAGDALPTTGADLMPALTGGVLAVVVGVILLLLTAGRPGRHRPGRHRV